MGLEFFLCCCSKLFIVYVGPCENLPSGLIQDKIVISIKAIEVINKNKELGRLCLVDENEEGRKEQQIYMIPRASWRVF